MLVAPALGSLHGASEESEAYLNNQMPRTISTKPDYSVRFWRKHGFKAWERDTFELMRRQATYRYESAPPHGESWIYHRDMRQLPWISQSLPGPIKLVVTSPPYLDVTNFEEDQWLRLWFLGGPPYPTRGRISRDDRHGRADNYWGFIADMWRMLGALVGKKGHVVIRLGGCHVTPDEIQRQLVACSQFSQRKIRLVSHGTSELKGRQTDAFRPGTKGCLLELDCHFQFAN